MGTTTDEDTSDKNTLEQLNQEYVNALDYQSPQNGLGDIYHIDVSALKIEKW